MSRTKIRLLTPTVRVILGLALVSSQRALWYPETICIPMSARGLGLDQTGFVE